MKKVAKENTSDVVFTASTVPVKIKTNEPLSLNLDFGRQDLNENFLKIQEAINELKKC